MRVIQFMIGSYGGAERFFVRLCSALAGRGVEQLLLINDHPALVADVQASGLAHQIFKPSRWGGLVDQFRVARLCRSFEADIVMAWMNRAGRRLPPGGRGVRIGRLGGYYPVKNYRRCDHLIANAPGILAHSLEQGWPKARISMISNFTEPMPPRVNGDDFGVPAGVPVICALGRFDPWKGFDDLIEALAQVPGAVLLLAGQGEREGELRALAARHGVTDRVRFLGWLDDRAALFHRADLCVVPSRHEPLGNVVLEAWSAGCPVIAAASEGPGWLIESGRTGLLVPPGDARSLAQAINQGLAEPGTRAAWAAAAKLRWEREFTTEAICTAYIALFEKVMRRGD